MHVWVTRSEPGASTLTAALVSAGHSVTKAPVLDIEPLDFELPQGRFDLGLVLSVHGARHAGGKVLAMLGETFAVGRQTQQALRDQGCEAEAPEVATSEGLLEALGDVAGSRVLIITGRGGRRLLEETLADRGAQVQRLDVYERRQRTPTELAPDFIEAIVASSGDGFEYAVRVWFAAGGSNEVPVLVPSDRVAALADELGMINVHNCAGADSDAVLSMLRRLAGEP